MSMDRKHLALKQLLNSVDSKINKENINPKLLRKLWKYISEKEKPNKDVLDKISLLIGFQDWESFKETIYGDTDAQVNYEGDDDKK